MFKRLGYATPLAFSGLTHRARLPLTEWQWRVTPAVGWTVKSLSRT